MFERVTSDSTAVTAESDPGNGFMSSLVRGNISLFGRSTSTTVGSEIRERRSSIVRFSNASEESVDPEALHPSPSRPARPESDLAMAHRQMLSEQSRRRSKSAEPKKKPKEYPWQLIMKNFNEDLHYLRFAGHRRHKPYKPHVGGKSKKEREETKHRLDSSQAHGEEGKQTPTKVHCAQRPKVFGTSSERFPRVRSPTPDQLGPGVYEAPPVTTVKEPKRASSAFATVDREYLEELRLKSKDIPQHVSNWHKAMDESAWSHGPTIRKEKKKEIKSSRAEDLKNAIHVQPEYNATSGPKADMATLIATSPLKYTSSFHTKKERLLPARSVMFSDFRGVLKEPFAEEGEVGPGYYQNEEGMMTVKEPWRPNNAFAAGQPRFGGPSPVATRPSVWEEGGSGGGATKPKSKTVDYGPMSPLTTGKPYSRKGISFPRSERVLHAPGPGTPGPGTFKAGPLPNKAKPYAIMRSSDPRFGKKDWSTRQQMDLQHLGPGTYDGANVSGIDIKNPNRASPIFHTKSRVSTRGSQQTKTDILDVKMAGIPSSERYLAATNQKVSVRKRMPGTPKMVIKEK